MTFYHPRQVENFLQVFLNGIIRPRRFFSNSSWDGNLFESMFVLFSSLLLHLSLYAFVYKSFSMTEGALLALLFSTVVFALASLLYMLRAVGFLQVYNTLGKFISAVSYLSVCHLLVAPIMFYSTLGYQMLQLYLVGWGIYGITHGFIGFQGLQSIKTFGLYALVVLTSTVTLYRDYFSVDNEDTKVEFRNVMSVESPKASEVNLFSHYSKLGAFKPGDAYYFSFTYTEKEKKKRGSMKIQVVSVSEVNNVAQVVVTGYFNGREQKFRHSVYFKNQKADYSFLMKSQKPNLKTALRLITTSLGTVHKLKYLAGFQAKLHDKQKVVVQPASFQSEEAHTFYNLPSLVADFVEGEQNKKFNMTLSKASALPVKMTGAIKTGTRYQITLVRKRH